MNIKRKLVIYLTCSSNMEYILYLNVEYIQQNHINSNTALKKSSGTHKI